MKLKITNSHITLNNNIKSLIIKESNRIDSYRLFQSVESDRVLTVIPNMLVVIRKR